MGKVLVACEESQVVCKAFRALGHEAYSCDIVECSGGHPEWHIQVDVSRILYPSMCWHPWEDYGYGIGFDTMDGKYHFIPGSWDLVIAHPPCTYMSKAGARWMYPRAGYLDKKRLNKALAAKAFFMLFYNLDNTRVCIENPVPLRVVNLPCFTQKIQPYEYGEPYSKATCFWLKNLPPLQSTQVLSQFEPWCASNTSAFSRGAKGSRGVAKTAVDRSRTFSGIAAAMAEQWGVLI